MFGALITCVTSASSQLLLQQRQIEVCCIKPHSIINIQNKVSLGIILSVKRCMAFMDVAGPIKPYNRLTTKFHAEKHYPVKALCQITPSLPLQSIIPTCCSTVLLWDPAISQAVELSCDTIPQESYFFFLGDSIKLVLLQKQAYGLAWSSCGGWRCYWFRTTARDHRPYNRIGKIACYQFQPNSVPVNISFAVKEGIELHKMSDSELQLPVHGHVSFCCICYRNSHLWQRAGWKIQRVSVLAWFARDCSLL